jgi:phospho-N-acetylmuramoyl-pentapeptide-transferase
MEGLRLGASLLLLGAGGGILAVWIYLKGRLYGQYVRPEGPATHFAKAGTPTMGGLPLLLLFLAAWAAFPLWPVAVSWRGLFVLLSAAGGGAIGLLDDLLSQRRRRSEGLPPLGKLALQLVVATGLFWMIEREGADAVFLVPFSHIGIQVGMVPAPLLFLLVLLGFWGTANGANLTDGLDGLAAGCGIVILLGFLSLVSPFPELVAASFLGAGLFSGFLWWNVYPARTFMGDVGSMFLGGLVFGVATAAGGLLLLPIFAGIFVVESLSVIAQVLSFKLFGVRILKMSPLHHHLEEGDVPWSYLLPSPGWPEPKVVVRLWLLAGFFVALGILSV